MDDFDLRIQPIAFEEFRRRLRLIGIEATGEHVGAITFRMFRMGLGTPGFYSVAYRRDDGMVYPPTIEAVLRYFGIEASDWAADVRGAEEAE